MCELFTMSAQFPTTVHQDLRSETVIAHIRRATQGRQLLRNTQQVALLAGVPLSRERWEPVSEGEIVVLRKGRVVQRRALVGGTRARLRS